MIAYGYGVIVGVALLLAACGGPAGGEGVAVAGASPFAGAVPAQPAAPATEEPDMVTPQIRCVRAPCGDVPPEAASARVSEFYTRFADFYLDPDPAQAWLSPGFYALLHADVVCAQHEGMCAIGADPWSAAQDGDRQGPIEVRTMTVEGVSQGMPTRATVQLCFGFVLEAHAPQRRCAQVRVVRQAGASWQVDDVVDAEGQSLRALLS